MDALPPQAWGDESVRTVRVDQPSYLLGAAVADPSSCVDIRNTLSSLPRRGPKLHWRDLDVRSRRDVVRTIAELDIFHIVVVAAPIEARRQERARALCLERLAWQLDGLGVRRLTLEARPPQLMRRDLRTIDALRSKYALPAGLRVEHAQPSTEPMLWIADQVLGALGERMAGGRSEFFERIRSSVALEHIELQKRESRVPSDGAGIPTLTSLPPAGAGYLQCTTIVRNCFAWHKFPLRDTRSV